MNELGRLKLVIKHLIGKGVGANQREIGLQLGYTNESSLSQILNGKTPVPKNFYRRLQSLDPCINPVWIKTGEQEMLNAEEITIQANRFNYQKTSVKGIPVFNLDLSGAISGNVFEPMQNAHDFIYFSQLNDCTAAFPIYGDSMEPDFYAGEIAIVKEISNIDSMLWGEPYLIITNSNCDNLSTVKNVFISDDRKQLILRANNPKYLGDTYVSRDDVIKIFLVKGKVSKRQL